MLLLVLETVASIFCNASISNGKHLYMNPSLPVAQEETFLHSLFTSEIVLYGFTFHLHPFSCRAPLWQGTQDYDLFEKLIPRGMESDHLLRRLLQNGYPRISQCFTIDGALTNKLPSGFQRCLKIFPQQHTRCGLLTLWVPCGFFLLTPLPWIRASKLGSAFDFH